MLFLVGWVGGDVDFLKVFDMCSVLMFVINVKLCMIIVVNKVVMKVYYFISDILDSCLIMEMLLYLDSFNFLFGVVK